MTPMWICQCGCICHVACCGGRTCGHRPEKSGSDESFGKFMAEWRRPPVTDPQLVAAYEWVSQRFPELTGAEDLRRLADSHVAGLVQ
jgi:hypothetical protein